MISFRLADAEILRKPDYFGKFGKIHKVVINHSTQYAGSQLQVSLVLIFDRLHEQRLFRELHRGQVLARMSPTSSPKTLFGQFRLSTTYSLVVALLFIRLEMTLLSSDGRTLKASLGTTKYCSHFMKNQSCPKNDCMYLHELGDDLASFTKEQMQQV